MAGPAFIGVGTRAASASAATITPPLPSQSYANGLLIAVCTSKNNAVHSTASAGWTKVGQQNSGPGFTASLFIAPRGAAAPAAPVITWTGAAACSAQIAHCFNHEGIVDAVLGATAVGWGAANPHATASISTTRANSRVLYIDVAAANTALATPAGWTEHVDAGAVTDVGRTVWGGIDAAAAGSASGDISVTGAAAEWVQWQLEIMQGPDADFQASKAEVIGWYEPPEGIGAAKAEVIAWWEAPDEYDVSKAEVVMLFEPRRVWEGLSVRVTDGDGDTAELPTFTLTVN